MLYRFGWLKSWFVHVRWLQCLSTEGLNRHASAIHRLTKRPKKSSCPYHTPFTSLVCFCKVFCAFVSVKNAIYTMRIYYYIRIGLFLYVYTYMPRPACKNILRTLAKPCFARSFPHWDLSTHVSTCLAWWNITRFLFKVYIFLSEIF